jgi:peptidoglycan/xylan/chitin deacetylase (PgdA/CDA1 family)
MQVSLTFDNGPDLEITPGVLDTLAAHDAKATFFLLGKNIANPEVHKLAERASREGHRIGNHSFSHSVPFGLLENPFEGVQELLATDELLGSLRGGEPLYRPFGRANIGRHLLNAPTWQTLVERKYTVVLWTHVAPERLQPDTWMKTSLEECKSRPWSVVVMHDIPTGGTRHLGTFLRMLEDAGTELSQDFPVDCTPLRKGVEHGSPEALMPAALEG